MLRILLIDDNPLDRLLVIRVLERQFPNLQIQEVANVDNFSLALEGGQFDLVITDYQLRWSNGLAVLNSVKSLYPNCPVIMFTNSGTQEIAVEALKAGLEDYVLKSAKHYIRLAAAVNSVWEKAQKKRKVASLENRLQGLLNNLNIGVFRQSLDGSILEGNFAFFDLLGMRHDSLFVQKRPSIQSYFQPEDYAQIRKQLTEKKQIKDREIQLQRADSSRTWVRLSQTVSVIEGETIVDGLIEDINAQKIAEQERIQLLEELDSKQKFLEAVLQQMPAGVIIAEAPSGRVLMMNEQVPTVLQRIQLGQPYADIVKNAQVGLTVWQLEDFSDPGSWRLVTANPAASELSGVNLESFIGRTIAEGFPTLVDRQSLSKYTEVVQTGQAKDLGEVRYGDEQVALGIFSLKAFPLPNRCVGIAFENITKRKQVEEALQDALTKLNFHFENTPLAVIERDLDFCVTRWSKSAEKVFGWRAEEIIGQDWQAVYIDDIETVKALKTSLLSGEEKQNISHNRTYTKDGSVVECEWYNSALFDQSGNFVSILSLVLDVTARKQAEAERQRLLKLEQTARTQAETANRIKDEFLAVLSHELRSPLNPILGWVKLLRSRKLDESQISRALETIERNAILQTQLIEDLLDVSRIMRGKTSLTISPVNLATTIEAASDTVRLSAQAKSIQLQLDLNPNVGLVSGDSNRLQQVVWNLLSNAIKFTPAGGCVTICLEQKGTQAQIQVSDLGKGISAEFLPHVFEYFRQADSSTTRNQGGLGLGLAIVRNLVELHGGTVAASSPGLNLGATFTVSIPLRLESPSPKTADSLELSLGPEETPNRLLVFEGARILVVDDEKDTREFYRAVLEQQGAAVTTVASVSEALESFEEQRPDVILSDIGMPVQDGYSLIRQVRALELQGGRRIPAVAMTAYARDIDRTNAIAAGFQKHLSKPVAPDQLVAVVAHLLLKPSTRNEG